MKGNKKSKGILRNRFQSLNLAKQAQRKKSSRQLIRKHDRFAKQNLLGLSQLSDSTPSNLRQPFAIELERMPTMSQLPPQWVQHYEKCLDLIAQIDEIKKKLMIQQNRRLSLIKVSEQKQSERKIYDLTTTATKKIKLCESLLMLIKKQQPDEQQSDKRTRNNVCMSLAVSIQQKTRELRNQQKAFVQQRQNIENSTKVSFLQLAATKAYDNDFQDDEKYFQDQEQLQLQLKVNSQRNQQILKIVQSIHELNDLYKQLNNLVILQGSLLDRIDYNIQESVIHVKKADETLGKVDQRQKKSKCSCIVIIIMLLAVIILGIILIVRWSK